MNKVSLNGVEIYPFDSEQSLLSFVNDNKGILVAINIHGIAVGKLQFSGHDRCPFNAVMQQGMRRARYFHISPE